MPSQVLQPGDIEPPKSEIPFLRLPECRTLFAARAQRLRQLAQGHSMGDYLLTIGHIADAQQAVLDAHGKITEPSEQHLAHCHEHGMPPLGALALTRDKCWHDDLQLISRAVLPHLPALAAAAAQHLLSAGDDAVEQQANALLSGETQHLNPASAPLVGATLQVYWAQLARQLGSTAFPRIDPPHLCPVCGSRPVASIARIGGEHGGYRYLHCSLCSTEWHMVRIKCTSCESTKGIAYQHLETGATASGAPQHAQAIKAETCDECKSYAKIVYMERDPLVEPTADDLATLALDFLVDELGYRRTTPNLMLSIPAS